jgi:hypothetical protein
VEAETGGGGLGEAGKGRRTACAFDLITTGGGGETERCQVCLFMWRRKEAAAGGFILILIFNFWHANGRALGTPGLVSWKLRQLERGWPSDCHGCRRAGSVTVVMDLVLVNINSL